VIRSRTSVRTVSDTGESNTTSSSEPTILSLASWPKAAVNQRENKTEDHSFFGRIMVKPRRLELLSRTTSIQQPLTPKPRRALFWELPLKVPTIEPTEPLQNCPGKVGTASSLVCKGIKNPVARVSHSRANQTRVAGSSLANARAPLRNGSTSVSFPGFAFNLARIATERLHSFLYFRVLREHYDSVTLESAQTFFGCIAFESRR
jgi:hypothetical protein